MGASLRLRLLAAPALLACACSSGQVQKVTGVFAMTPAVVDFGNVCLNSTSQFPVNLANSGLAPVKIISGTVAGSAFTLITPMPASLAPHTSVVVQIAFTPTEGQAYSGRFTVTTDAPKNATQIAELKGTGAPGAKLDFEVSCLCDPDGNGGYICGNGHTPVTPCRFLDFGNVVTGTSAQATVTVQNNGCMPLNFTQAQFSDTQDTPPSAAARYADWFSLNPQPPATIRGGQSASYAVTFAPTDIPASPNVQLVLSSDDPTPPRTSEGQTVAGSWSVGMFAVAVTPALQVTPDILTFFNAQVGVPSMQTFLIENTGTAVLHIENVALTGDTADFSLQIPGGHTSFDIQPASPSDTGVTVVFTPSGAGGKTANVEVTATGSPPQNVQLLGGAEPQLQVVWLDPNNANAETAPPVDFGQTMVGATGVQRTVRLRNLGSANLSVTGVTTKDITNMMPSGSFSVSTMPSGTIAPQQTSDFIVVFNDDIFVTNDSGKLDIATDDPVDAPNGGSRSVDLTSTNSAIYAPIPDVAFSPASPQACQTLTLDASGTTDAQSDPLLYAWTINSAPPGSHAALSAPSAVKTNVTSSGCAGPDIPGTYIFNLTVTDMTYPSAKASLLQQVVVH
jgi:hypothetical protein